MTKAEIVERLIDQGHIVMSTADRILNKRDGYVRDIQDLHTDGPISTAESIILLRDSVLAPVHIQPDIINLPHISYPYNPGPSGTPPNIYCQTTTLDNIQN